MIQSNERIERLIKRTIFLRFSSKNFWFCLGRNTLEDLLQGKKLLSYGLHSKQGLLQGKIKISKDFIKEN